MQTHAYGMFGSFESCSMFITLNVCGMFLDAGTVDSGRMSFALGTWAI